MKNKIRNEKYYNEYYDYFSQTNPDEVLMSFTAFVEAHDLDNDDDQEPGVCDPSHPIHY